MSCCQIFWYFCLCSWQRNDGRSGQYRDTLRLHCTFYSASPALHCTVRCTVLHCTMHTIVLLRKLYWNKLYCIVLYCRRWNCTVLQKIVLHTKLLCTLNCTMLYFTALHFTLHCTAPPILGPCGAGTIDGIWTEVNTKYWQVHVKKTTMDNHQNILSFACDMWHC